MTAIADLTALEILDSRGRPTVQATLTLASGARGTASVPSGASTGRAEALELRDRDPARYRGLGCRKAVANVNTVLRAAVVGRAFTGQAEFDHTLIALDGTANKARLGANAVLAASAAFAKACAAEHNLPLYGYFAALTGEPARRLPRPTINLFSGGKHAGGQVAIQDVLVVPQAATIDACLADTFAVYQAAADWCYEQYGMRLLTADEGGLAPAFPDDDAMLADAVRAIDRAGLIPGEQVALALDVAASHFYHDGGYAIGGVRLDGRGLIAKLLAWAAKYPLVSIEDGLAEDDWPHWPLLTAALPAPILALGDDLLCTNPARIDKAVAAHAATALLLKVNQIGTFTEALDACQRARRAGWAVVVSARSGETEDDWLADLAVGWSADYIKVGSITQSERLAKYNRLLAIEAETGFPIPA